MHHHGGMAGICSLGFGHQDGSVTRLGSAGCCKVREEGGVLQSGWRNAHVGIAMTPGPRFYPALPTYRARCVVWPGVLGMMANCLNH